MATIGRSLLARLYPERWRRRYGDEFRAMLDDEPLSPSLVLDVLAGALGAHLAYATEEPIMSTRRLQAATASIAVVAIATTLFVLAAAVAKELLVSQARAGAGSTMLPEPAIERLLVIAAGAGLALVLGLAALGWRLRTSTWLRNDLAQFGRLLRRLAMAAGLIAVLCALAVLIVGPVLLILSDR